VQHGGGESWQTRLLRIDKKAIQRVQAIPARWRRKYVSDAVANAARPFDLYKRPEFENKDLWALSHMAGEGLPLNASDDDVCAVAEARAQECARAIMRTHSPFSMLAAALAVCDRVRVGHPRGDTLEAIYKRTCCAIWWRRSLRRAHARHVEGAAISLGIVNKRGDKYVSEESRVRRQQLAQRNAGMLANQLATNEEGDTYSLAELAALSVSNPAIRRGELMVRIRGLEELASEAGHVAEFVTLTCPSRMHSTLSGSGERNPRFDGTLPRDAQDHLRNVWALARSAFVRAGLRVYGLRVSEPHHDGCPHWHLLVFMPAWCDGEAKRRAAPRFRAIMRRYALADSPSERGAWKHRVKLVSIDAAKGTAAGYVAKYVAKAVGDVDVDAAIAEYGVSAENTSGLKDRADKGVSSMSPVAAWARTHGIRQFQFFGTPPVGLWRAVRRLSSDDVAGHWWLMKAWLASQKIVSQAWLESPLRHEFPEMANLPQHTKAASYADFVRACGGIVGWKEARRFDVMRRTPDGVNRYGEAKGRQVVGVMVRESGEVVPVPVHEWTIKRGRVQSRAPWTRFNNCTHAIASAEHVDTGKARAIMPHAPQFQRMAA
jgi:hypothetical protein